MNGLLRISTIFSAVALLALEAVVGPAFAHDGDNSGSGSGSNSGKAEEHSAANEHSGDHSDLDKKPERPGDKGGNEGEGSDELPETEAPKEGKHLNASVEHGIILVRMPGTHRTVVLHNAASLPVGAVVDARHGAVTFVTVPNEQGEPQKATFSGSVF
jgi:hypothetical protein